MTSTPDKAAKDVPWHAPLRVEDVHEAGRHVVLTADAATLKALAAFADVESVTGLQATFDGDPGMAGPFAALAKLKHGDGGEK